MIRNHFCSLILNLSNDHLIIIVYIFSLGMFSILLKYSLETF